MELDSAPALTPRVSDTARSVHDQPALPSRRGPDPVLAVGPRTSRAGWCCIDLIEAAVPVERTGPPGPLDVQANLGMTPAVVIDGLHARSLTRRTHATRPGASGCRRLQRLLAWLGKKARTQ